jgi:hypothetical protein
MFNIFKKTKKEPENLREVISKISELEKSIQNVGSMVQEMRERDKKHIQRIGIVRFNPFSGVGGDQSFSIALLDGDNNGITITSLYGKEGNRVYAKPIEGGKSQYQLSDEEQEAIRRAMSFGNLR